VIRITVENILWGLEESARRAAPRLGGSSLCFGRQEPASDRMLGHGATNSFDLEGGDAAEGLLEFVRQ
jgi:hypothetical protein